MQQIYQAANIIEASIIKGLLEQGGIQASINGYYLQGGVGELPASGTVSVWVDDLQIIQAQQLIADYRDQS
jgi:hypothetical protein